MGDHNNNSLTGFLRLAEVLMLVPVGKSSWWRGVQTGRFPRPVKLGPRTTAWLVEDIAVLITNIRETKK